MKIRIRTEGCKLCIPLPNSLLAGSLGRFALGHAQDKNGEAMLTDGQIRALQQGLREAKRNFGRITLVEVHTVKGEHVVITL